MREKKLTIATLDLVLRDDDLHAVRILRTRDRVLKKADRANDPAALKHADLAFTLSDEVRWVSDLQPCQLVMHTSSSGKHVRHSPLAWL